jgi:hypothetical protein
VLTVKLPKTPEALKQEKKIAIKKAGGSIAVHWWQGDKRHRA